jgi:hypothetical protein
MVNSSIEYSGLLITRTLQPDKHQLRDFFNRHACSQQLPSELRVIRLIWQSYAAKQVLESRV